MDRVYESRDHDCFSVHGGLTTMGHRGRSGAQEFVMIARRERGGHRGSHRWRHLEVELWRWPHNDPQ
jgi:hypothetical protein